MIKSQHPYLIKTGTLLCTEASFFIISRIWKWPRYSSAGEWIKYTVVCLGNEILFSWKNENKEMKLNEKTWEDMGKPKCILLSVNRQTKKASYGMIPIVWRSGKDKTMVAAERWVVTRKELVEGAQRIFRAVNLFCILKGLLHFIRYLFKTHGMCKAKVNPNANSVLWVMLTCQRVGSSMWQMCHFFWGCW